MSRRRGHSSESCSCGTVGPKAKSLIRTLGRRWKSLTKVARSCFPAQEAGDLSTWEATTPSLEHAPLYTLLKSRWGWYSGLRIQPFSRVNGEGSLSWHAGEIPGRDAEGATEATGMGGMETPPKEL